MTMTEPRQASRPAEMPTRQAAGFRVDRAGIARRGQNEQEHAAALATLGRSDDDQDGQDDTDGLPPGVRRESCACGQPWCPWCSSTPA